MCEGSTIFGHFEILTSTGIAMAGLCVVAILSPDIESRTETEAVGNCKMLDATRQVSLARPQIQISIRSLNEPRWDANLLKSPGACSTLCSNSFGRPIDTLVGMLK